MSFPGVRVLVCFAYVVFSAATAWAETTLEAPASVPSGSRVTVSWTGPSEEYDTIRVVPVGTPDDERPGHSESYTFSRSPIGVVTPEPPGEYEIRFMARGTRLLARRKLVITPVTATLEAPSSVLAGNAVSVKVTGPRNESDTIAVLPAGAAEGASPGSYYAYTFQNDPVSVVTPEEPGQYEIRYVRAQSGSTLARAALTVSAVMASVHGPGTAVSGATISVAVTGPHSEHDTIAVLPAGAPDGESPGSYYAFTFGKSAVSVRVPEPPGEYEIRYVTAASRKTLAREKLTIGATSASIQGPGKTPAGQYFKVSWKGPGNEYDHIAVAPKGAPEDKWTTSNYLFARSPATLLAPVAVGSYELRYQTGESGTTLARDDLEVIPAKEEPGRLSVTLGQGNASAAGAVEIILDASGSMLQRIGSERRIDIAKRTLSHLTANVIPARMPFALRVFGRKANSCQSELDIPLAPLDGAAVATKIASLEAESNAKTPIAASLERVSSDLSSVKGERLVILVTDGEETCGGNPQRSIGKLLKSGVNVRVNIVGFAVDDARIAATFRQWSVAGNGAYFDARDGAGLDEALALAIRPAFEVLDSKKRVVADGPATGEPVALMPGTYTVSLKGQKGRSQRVTVRARETASVRF